MKKTLLSMLASVIALTSATTALAEGTLYLGYCDGQLASSGTGLAGTNATITEAIRIPGSMLNSYVGCQISGINAGLASSSSYPEQLTGWISATKGGDTITSAVLANPSSGWNVINLDQAYTITGEEEELWIGFDFVQAKKLSIISFAGETHPDGVWIAKNGKYTDYSSKNFGSLSLEAILTGESIPTHDLSITSLTTTYEMTQIGSPVKVKVGVRNSASVAAVNPVIEYAVNGKTIGSYTYPGTLTYRQKDVIRLEIPTDGYTEEGTLNISAKIAWADGSTDEAPADNEASVEASLVSEVFYRTMVAEEGTGAWCGWCVRGLVGLKYMRDNYPDQFIGIGVHNGDTYAVSAYDSWMGNQISGYPSALINRDGNVYDPSSQELEQALENMPALTSAQITASVSLNEDRSILVVHTKTQFLISNSSANYRVAYVVLEDKLPISQSNYYSGGSYGAMGGFENLPSKADIEIDDVARGIFPEPQGAAGIIPTEIVAKEVYESDYAITLPTLANIENAWLAVLLINANTKEIIQATKVPSLLNSTGIRNIAAERTTTGSYDLMGRGTSAKGIRISNGKVIFVR